MTTSVFRPGLKPIENTVPTSSVNSAEVQNPALSKQTVSTFRAAQSPVNKSVAVTTREFVKKWNRWIAARRNQQPQQVSSFSPALRGVERHRATRPVEEASYLSFGNWLHSISEVSWIHSPDLLPLLTEGDLELLRESAELHKFITEDGLSDQGKEVVAQAIRASATELIAEFEDDE